MPSITDSTLNTADYTKENGNGETFSNKSDAASDDDALKSFGSLEGEKLLAFLDHVRNTYELDTGSLNLPQVIDAQYTFLVLLLTELACRCGKH
jgi:hypothetical protein